MDSRGPIFFKQIRVGHKGKYFHLYKFRTMVQNVGKKVIRLTVKNDPRITKIGRFLRKYKIDELPQLMNIVKGEMSFVGPRPELPEYVNLFREDYKYIQRAKPGLTDFASIKFRNESELLINSTDTENMYINVILPKKIKLYKKYVKERSFSLDMYLIFLTISCLIKK